MTPTLLGVPLAMWSMACFLLAFVWIMVWPYKVAPKRGAARFILRWGHAVVWMLLGMAALVGGSNGFGGLQTAHFLALASVAVYVVFVIFLLRYSRRAERA